MEVYELMVLYPVQGASADSDSLLKTVEGLIKKHKGTIVNQDDWGEKSLAYAVNGHERGRYIVYKLNMDRERVRKLNKQFRLEKGVLRWLFTSSSEEDAPVKKVLKKGD